MSKANLKSLVNDGRLHQEFLSYIDERIIVWRKTLDSAKDVVEIYRCQGAIQELKRLKSLKAEMNGEDGNK